MVIFGKYTFFYFNFLKFSHDKKKKKKKKKLKGSTWHCVDLLRYSAIVTFDGYKVSSNFISNNFFYIYFLKKSKFNIFFKNKKKYRPQCLWFIDTVESPVSEYRKAYRYEIEIITNQFGIIYDLESEPEPEPEKVEIKIEVEVDVKDKKETNIEEVHQKKEKVEVKEIEEKDNEVNNETVDTKDQTAQGFFFFKKKYMPMVI